MADVWRPKRLRCFFMHIPKTAGMSMRAILAGQYEVAHLLPASDWDQLARVERPLSDYKLYAGHFRQAFRGLIPRDTFTFTFLRDPAERTISHLLHLQRDPAFNVLHEQVRGRDLRALLEDPHILLHCANIQTRYLASTGKVARRRDLLRASEEAVLAPEDVESAEQNLDTMSFVGFVDTYAEDVTRLLGKLGLHPQDELPRFNAAASSHQMPISAELLEMARHVNGADYLLYESARRKRSRARPAAISRAAAVERLVDRGFYPVIRGDMEFALDGPLPASGFWPAEGVHGHSFRWTGPSLEVVFDLPFAANCKPIFEIGVYLPHSVGRISSFIDGRQANVEISWQDEASGTIVLPIDLIEGRNLVHIRLVCEKQHVASESDKRSIGMVVTRLSVKTKVDQIVKQE